MKTFFPGLIFCKTCYARLHGPQVRFTAFLFILYIIIIYILSYLNEYISAFLFLFCFRVLATRTPLCLTALSRRGWAGVKFSLFLSPTTGGLIFYALFQLRWQMIWRSLFRYFSLMFCCSPGAQYSWTPGTIQLIINMKEIQKQL